MSGISTHVLDLARGRPASGVQVTLEVREPDGGWRALGADRTDDDGRIGRLLPEGQEPSPATYRLRFRTGPYFEALGKDTFYPHVEIAFRVARADEHYHVPLLLGAFGYTTYRGS